MQKRVAIAALTAVLTVASLAGCQATTPGSFTRAGAQADVATWTHDAESAVGSPTADVHFDGFETCRTDHAFFATSFEWRTVTFLGVAQARQPAAIAAISANLTARHWSATTSNGFVTLSGPKNARRSGVIRLERSGSAALVVTAISPCYR